ncbi:MAG: peptidylprolyl isomerase [Lysobacterales bacterium]
MRFLREPLLHFLLIGAAFFLFYGVFSKPGPDKAGKTIVVSAAEIEWMKASWQQRWNRPPAAIELDGLIQDYIRETILYREALALGLDKDDGVIRRRLGLKMEFLAADLVGLNPPGDDELQTYFETHRERYQDPPLFTFTQVYFDPDKRGDATIADAEAVKAQLVAGGDVIDDPGLLGDRLMLGNDYVDKDQVEIQKLFGSVFAQSLVQLTPGQWYGPLPSGYGVHLVYLSRVTEPPGPDFAAVRDNLVQDWTMEKGDELKEKFYDGLREQYTIVVEQPAADAKVTRAAAQSE